MEPYIFREWGSGEEKKISEQIERIEKLSESLKIVTEGAKTTWLSGDFNLDAARYEDDTWSLKTVAKRLTEITSELGFRKIRVGPTYNYRVGNEIRSSELDYFFTNDLDQNSVPRVGVIECGFSDHDAALLELPHKEIKKATKKIYRMQGKIKNEKKFKFDIRKAVRDYMAKSQMRTCEEKARALTDVVAKVIENNCPKKRVSINSTPPRCHLSNETRTVINERNAARKMIRQVSPSERHIQHVKYKTLRNRAVTLLRNDRRKAADEQLTKGRNPWHVANFLLKKDKNASLPLIEEGKRLETDIEKAEAMNAFFVEKVKRLRKRIDDSKLMDPLQKLKEKFRNRNINFSFRDVSMKEVERIMKRMKKSRSSGVDGISTELIKPVIKELLPAITDLINSSLREGIFPQAFKLAKVVCIYKSKGDKSDKNNYRPISNLPVFGKYIEVAVDVQLRMYCEKYGLLGKHQHGFRKSRSTTTALLTAITKWKSSKANKKFQAALMFDLSAAYDLLDRDVFLAKAEIYGITGRAQSWLQSYLTDRFQAVQVNEARSIPMKLECGTPQGSSCSCLIFAMFVGDIEMWLNDCLTLAYADDTFISVEADSLEELQTKLKTEGEKVLDYFQSNRFITNPTKTGLLVFRPSNQRKENEPMILDLMGVQIEEIVEIKLLGTVISSDLKFQNHANKLTTDLNYSISVINRVRTSLSSKILKMLADGLVMSRIRYCSPVYGSEYIRLKETDPKSEILASLQKLQNRAMRLIIGKRKSDRVRVTDMIKRTGWLSVNQTFAYTSLVEMWKSKEFNIPHLHSLLQQKTYDQRTLRSVTNETMSNVRDEPYSRVVATLWNEASDRFKKTNLLIVAKKEAEQLARTLPV